MAMVQIPPRPWPTGTPEKPEPLVTRVLAPNPSPYTYTGTQTYLVGAGKDLAVIDPGPDEEAHLAALVDAIGERNVVAIMCTHTHRDHSPASIPLKARTGAPIIGCAPLALDSDGPRVSAIGLSDVIIVVDGDEVLVTTADGAQKVGKLKGAANQ